MKNAIPPRANVMAVMAATFSTYDRFRISRL